MNISKLVDEDEPLFMSLIVDLFTGFKLPTSTFKVLQIAIETTCNKQFLQNYPAWTLKSFQVQYIQNEIINIKIHLQERYYLIDIDLIE